MNVRTDTASTKLAAMGVALVMTLSLTEVAAAGVVVPAPLAGALGPAGLLAVAAAVGAYFLVRKIRGPR